jgi:GTP pyrophosphokinase
VKSSKANPHATIAEWTAHRTPAAGSLMAQALAAVTAGGANPALEIELTETLTILDALGVDGDTLAATVVGIALPPDHPLAHEPRLATLVEGQREAERIWALHRARGGGGAAEGLRRLLLAIIRDLRVVFILLARQLVVMRAAAKRPEPERRALAELTADMHAPLANRLGIWQVKWEMEDLAFRYLQPDVYKRIATLLDERRGDRERYIGQALTALTRALTEAGLRAEVAGRPKHIFSIWKKMQRKGVAFEHVYDVRALRVLVDDVPACYAALGIVHSLWPHVPGEFDDYVARPKGNQYRSLHTAVIGPEGKTLEVQIRTHDMHAHAELGVAAHWRYKEGGAADKAFERKVAAIRSMLETRGDTEGDAAFMAGMKAELLDDRVYLLTPQGKVVDVARGATVLDFAYHVHTEVGHRCRGAKVNGRIVTLHHQPQSGDTVEILTGKTAEPKRDWIVASAGFLNTHRAREKVRAWFKRADHERNVAAGRELLERELKRLALAHEPLESVAERFHFKALDDLYAGVGIGEPTPSQVARALHELAEPKPAKPLASAEPPKARRHGKDAVVVQGIGNLLHTIARCCQPLPGDPIQGWLTRGRGVSIHRADCRSLGALAARDASRVIQVEWGARDQQAYEVDVTVEAYDRKGLLKDVSAAITAADVHVVAASTRLDPAHGVAQMDFVLRVGNFEQLSSLLGRIRALPNVIEARRATARSDVGTRARASRPS